MVFQGPNGAGIRPTPYTTDMTVNPATYQDVIDDAGTTLSIPHGVGYVWASTHLGGLLEPGRRVTTSTRTSTTAGTTGGNNLALQLVIDGMKFQPCNPGFVTGGMPSCRPTWRSPVVRTSACIWEGFAKRGVGFSADQRSSKKTADGTAAFDLPPKCAECAGSVVPIGLTSLAAGGLEVARRQLRRRGMLRTTERVH